MGAGERAEFVRQNALLANIWTGLGALTCAVEEPDRHHFNIIDGLTDPDHPMVRELLGSDRTSSSFVALDDSQPQLAGLGFGGNSMPLHHLVRRRRVCLRCVTAELERLDLGAAPANLAR